MTADDTALLRIALVETYERMLAALLSACAAIRRDAEVPCWVARTELEMQQKRAMREKAIALYQTLWYEDGQDGRETVTCPGLVGASAETIAAAAACNDAKDAFKAAVLALKALNQRSQQALLETLHERDSEVTRALRRLGAARLNLKQAYRHVPLLMQRPVKVGFTWSKQARVIQRTTVAEARQLLERRRSVSAAEHEKLARLSESEMLARVRTVVPHLRANLVFEDGTGGIQRRLMQTPLPLLVPLAPPQPLPEFVPIPAEPVGQIRLRRSDVRIEDEPFLPSIRIHRYKTAYRSRASQPSA